MDDKEVNMIADDKKLTMRIIKSLLYTGLTTFLSVVGLYQVICLIRKPTHGQDANLYFIFSICVGIIFVTIFSSLTIIDYLKKLTKKF